MMLRHIQLKRGAFPMPDKKAFMLNESLVPVVRRPSELGVKQTGGSIGKPTASGVGALRTQRKAAQPMLDSLRDKVGFSFDGILDALLKQKKAFTAENIRVLSKNKPGHFDVGGPGSHERIEKKLRQVEAAFRDFKNGLW